MPTGGRSWGRGSSAMELMAVVSTLGLGESAELIAEEWEVSQRSLPPERPLFLEPEYVAATCREAYLPAEIAAAAAAAAGRIGADGAAAALAWHCRHCLFHAPTYPSERIWRWPHLGGVLQQDAGLFYLLVLLSGVPELQAIYRERAIPDEVARDTLYDVERRLHEYQAEHGHWGLTPRYLTWLRNHISGQLYQLGRLQFAPGSWAGSARAYRHRSSGTVVALSEDGVRYRADGQMDGAGGVVDATGAWTSRLMLSGEEMIGYPIAPTGRALAREVWLSRAEWQQVLAPGDPVLHVHIPAGSPMDFDLCGRSLQQALAFFPRHFPAQPFVAFACGSWLLDAQFETLLPPTSNIVRFQQEVYLLPIRSDGRSALARVFDRVPTDLRQAPRDTTLRRALIDHLLNGGHLRGGRCFLLPEDLRWGSQVYRRSFPW